MTHPNFVICTRNEGYEVSLEVRKLYQLVPDPTAKDHKQIRIIDESGEDFLYPDYLFAPIDLPASLANHFSQAA